VTESPVSENQVLLSPLQVSRILDRFACEIIERNKGHKTLEIVGIEKAGVHVAQAIVERLQEMTDASFETLSLDIRPFRDDQNSKDNSEMSPPLPKDMTDRDVILVDDVLFTGRTVRAALDAIVHCGRPRSIQLLALIDRGNREFPIAATYIGRAIPTKHNEKVIVDSDNELGVFLRE